jgi:hypothetical protein
MIRKILIVTLGCLVTVASAAGALGGFGRAATSDFTDWTAADGTANTASGTVRGIGVAFTGSDLQGGSTLNGSFTGFSSSDFSPPLPTSDALTIGTQPGYSYELSFASPVDNPVLHLASLGSKLTFPAGTSVAKVSGTLSVSGNTVTGSLGGSGQNSDANGTVQIAGTSLSKLTFGGEPLPGAPNGDGFYLQLAATPATSVTPTPGVTPTVTATATPTTTAAPSPTATSIPSEGNTAPPRIVVRDTKDGRATYGCTTGSWNGVGPTPNYQYSWWRASFGYYDEDLGDGAVFAPQKVTTGQSFQVPPNLEGERFFCRVEVTGASSGKTLQADSDTLILTGKPGDAASTPVGPYGDFRVRGIDLLQVSQPNNGAEMFGWQTGGFFTFCGGGTPTAYLNFDKCATPAQRQRAQYDGVRLDVRKRTLARVFVDFFVGFPADKNQPLNVTLTPLYDNHTIKGVAGQPMTVQFKNPQLVATPYVVAKERADSSMYASFVIPSSWLVTANLSKYVLSMRADVSLPAGASYTECPPSAAAACATDNSYTLNGISTASKFPELTVRTLALLTGSQTMSSLRSPDEVLKKALEVYPGTSEVDVLPFDGEVRFPTPALADDFCKPWREADPPKAEPLRDCRMAAVDTAIGTWTRANAQAKPYSILLGVHNYDNGGGTEPGWSQGGTSLISGRKPIIAINDGTIGRPLTSAAHEWGHALELVHADTTCGGNSNEQVGEFWAPDQRGRLQGTTLERLTKSLSKLPYRERVDGTPSELYDLMSYCAPEANAWLSPRNWNRTMDFLERDYEANLGRRRARSTRADAGSAFVIGAIGPAGAVISDVVPAAAGNQAPAPDASSALVLRSLDAAGNPILEAGATIEPVHVHGSELATFSAPMADRAAAIELVSGGAVLDRRQSSQPPAVSVLTPKAGARVGSKGSLAVSWSATDADGDALEAHVDYAANGSDFHTVVDGVEGTRVKVPARLLDAGGKARIRVVVTDGFTHGSAVSAPFRAAGQPPTVRIVQPEEVQQAGPALLIGSAIDQRGKRLSGRSLTWFAGRKRLGTGQQLRATLPSGKVALRLRARDAKGQVGVASRRLRIAPVPLRLTALRAPTRVAHGAKRVGIRMSASIPATVRVLGRRYKVGPRARTLRIALPAKPRSGVLPLRLQVTAGRQHVGARVVVFRR